VIKISKLSIILGIIYFLVGCSNSVDVQPVNEKYYHFIAEVDGVTDQVKNNTKKETFKINYTLNIRNFNPTEQALKEYIDSYKDQDQEIKQIQITDRSRIYKVDSHGNKISSQPSELTKGHKIEFWVRPYPSVNILLEAEEIDILQN
jgi:hypothetical protein